MVHSANDKNLIHTVAYRSVPGRTAQGALLQKVLTLDMMRQLKQAGAIFECDATGCYDRIVP